MYVIHLILLISQINLNKASSSVAPSRLLVTRIGSCFGTNLPITISEMSLTRKDYDFTITGELNISADVASGWSIKATMQKCHDIRNLDTCDHYKSLTVVSSGCDGDDDDKSLQEKFFQYVTPRLSCPLKVGVYQISNYPCVTEDSDLTNAESKISTSVFGYTYRLDGYDVDYQKLLCVDAYLQLIYVRKHDWIGRQKFKPIRTSARNHTANDTVNPNNDVNDDAEVKTNNSKQAKNYAEDEKQHDTTDVIHDDDAVDDNHSDDEAVHRYDGAEVKNEGTEQDQNNAENVNQDSDNEDVKSDGDIKHDDDAVLDKHDDDSVDGTDDEKDDDTEEPDQQRNDDNEEHTETDE